MRTTSVFAMGIAGFALVLACSPISTNAHPPAQPRVASRPQFATQRYASTPCSTSYPTYSFVGVSGEGDVAAGARSGVMGGNQNDACAADSAIGAGAGNRTGSSASDSFIGAGTTNSITGTQNFIGGGEDNVVSGSSSFVGAGTRNTVSAIGGFVGAGTLNEVTGEGSFIGGGNEIFATGGGSTSTPATVLSGRDSFIGAGDQNTLAADESFIGAGAKNTIASAAAYSAILGGSGNVVSGPYSVVLGGFGNTASGSYGVVAGGDGNTAAGTLSFAAGYHADATHNGSFVWSDYRSGSDVAKDTAVNQFIVRASGGIVLYSNEAATSGVTLGAGSGTWASLSDRNAKTKIVPVDGASVLAKVATLPVSSWQYRSEPGVRHVGPMAQDFYAAFGTGVDDRHVTSIDESGVALAAIQRLDANLDRLRDRQAREDAHKDATIAALRAHIRTLDALVGSLLKAHAANGRSS